MSWIQINPAGRLAGPVWITSPIATWGTGQVASVGVAGQVYITAIYLPRACTISRLTCVISTGGGAGTKFRLGLYADNGRTPAGGTLLFDSGDQDATTTGVKSLALPNPVTVPAGFVWACLHTQDTTIQFVRYGGGNNVGLTDVSTEMLNGCFYNQAYGALASPCPTVTNGNGAQDFVTRIRIEAFY